MFSTMDRTVIMLEDFIAILIIILNKLIDWDLPRLDMAETKGSLG